MKGANNEGSFLFISLKSLEGAIIEKDAYLDDTARLLVRIVYQIRQTGIRRGAGICLARTYICHSGRARDSHLGTYTTSRLAKGLGRGRKWLRNA